MLVFTIAILSLMFKASSALDALAETQGKRNTNDKSRCKPNMVYMSTAMVCKCSKDGYWPNEECAPIFNTTILTSNKCEPNTFVMVSDCKVCHCNDEGKVDELVCTDNCPVKREGNRRTHKELGHTIGNCEPKSWYSLAPCQFCYCINVNKLVCNTGNRKHNTLLELGSYNVTVCGKDFIKEAIELIPEDQKLLMKPLREGKSKVKKVISPSPFLYKHIAPKETATTFEVIETPEIQIEVNREIKEKNAGGKNNNKEKDEYYSDSEEKKEHKQEKDVVKEIHSTQLPYDDSEGDDTRNSYESNEVEADKGEEEIVAESEQKGGSVADEDKDQEILISSKDVKDDEDEKALRQLLLTKNNEKPSKSSNFIKFNLPTVLDRIFKMALRKSMVKLDTKSSCEPGTTQNINCNTCFCLTNGKLLCTDKTC